MTPEQKGRVFRTNSLGSLYWFTIGTLRRRALTTSLHYPICLALESDHIKDVFELPRDHFKTTICSEGLPIWRALPFTKHDEDEFDRLGYSAEYIAWMHRVHNPNVRCLLISENITNASKIGYRVRVHFESNSLFRSTFPEILPTTKETWTNTSMHVRRGFQDINATAHGEGTFDFLGVGGALQSRHYNLIIQDDLVGKRALGSPTEMDKTIDFHRLLVGAFENEDKHHENDELVVGNRWSFSDLNSYIREHEPWFNFTTHGALGGCCSLHPYGSPIFPERFSLEKLAKIKARYGSYWYSCQFLNDPASPDNADFKVEWLRYFNLITAKLPEGDMAQVIQHRVYEGRVLKDLDRRRLRVCLISDPVHAGNASARRCRHSIVVVGLSDDDNYYFLDCWAEAGSYDTYINELYRMAAKWNLNKIGLETVAAQKYLKYHLDYRNRIENRRMSIIELEGEVEAPDGSITRKKEFRIRNILQPIFEENRFWCQPFQMKFIEEYSRFPQGNFVDILDALAYVPQMLRYTISQKRNSEFLRANMAGLRQINQPYSSRTSYLQ